MYKISKFQSSHYSNESMNPLGSPEHILWTTVLQQTARTYTDTFAETFNSSLFHIFLVDTISKGIRELRLKIKENYYAYKQKIQQISLNVWLLF